MTNKIEMFTESLFTPRPTAGDEFRAALISSGLSPQAIEGILDISCTAYLSFLECGKEISFLNAIDAVTKWKLTLEKFISTQTKKDQEAYALFCRKQEEQDKKRFF
ncbi:hypothetical protein GCK72_020812 [Caenorhabditis remanei]|uniref:Uncharacterized protein n=1 Tax=Caenorhabditis remanei TaxID=31234 RepID=A0A6A5GI88_CAERE|nr:hypothetical protein GCK72_020812 [Caenorhabditis remanei]KAF1754252.1 hypothetical protein GCK72_020812 [Caenorhabditis remanei]